MKKICSMLCIMVCMAFIVSCGKNDEEKTIAYDPSKPVELTSFRPDSGRIREMVLLDGSNFGTDTSKIKVFFNSREAKVLSSTGTRILALVPRLPGDTCVVSVKVDTKQQSYEKLFRYKVEASVTTLAGNGTNALVTTSLDQSQLRPVYIGVDKDFNVFVTATNNSNTMVRINELDNSIQVVATDAQAFNHRCTPVANPVTNIIQMGAEGDNNRDRFLFMDPAVAWTPKLYFIKNWNLNGFTSVPTPSSWQETHFHCLYCQADGNYYTRYGSGHIVKIDPKTWEATIIGMTPPGTAYGMALHPINTTELWLGYSSANVAGDVRHSLCMIDLLNPPQTSSPTDPDFHKLSGATAGGYRDGPVEMSQFREIRMINFDSDGNLFIGDSGNQCIRMLNTSTMMVETLIGIPGVAGMKDGAKENALFNAPHGIVVNAEGTIYVSDYENNRVRRIAIE